MQEWDSSVDYHAFGSDDDKFIRILNPSNQIEVKSLYTEIIFLVEV